MAGDTLLPVIGNLTGDPELRFTPSGAAVVNFTVASTPSRWDKEQKKFVDGDTLFMRCSAWRDIAENIAESLKKGQRVVVYGRLKQRSYDNKEGQKVTVVEMEVEDVGASLRYGTVAFTKSGETTRTGGETTPPGGDPWATEPDDQPPF